MAVLSGLFELSLLLSWLYCLDRPARDWSYQGRGARATGPEAYRVHPAYYVAVHYVHASTLLRRCSIHLTRLLGIPEAQHSNVQLPRLPCPRPLCFPDPKVAVAYQRRLSPFDVF